MTAIDTRPVEIDAQHKEQQLRSHQVLGELIAAVPADITIAGWGINSGIDAHLSSHGLTDAQIRAEVRSLAGLFGLAYDEKDHGSNQNIVTATGHVGGVPVRFWKLVARCTCDCGKAAGA
jgi:hypothetical protein